MIIFGKFVLVKQIKEGGKYHFKCMLDHLMEMVNIFGFPLQIVRYLDEVDCIIVLRIVALCHFHESNPFPTLFLIFKFLVCFSFS